MYELDEEKLKYIVAEKVKRYRNKTQEETVGEASISSDTLSATERAKSVMKISTLVKLCNALEVTPNDILEDFITNRDKILEQKLAHEIAGLTMKEKEYLEISINFIKTHREK